MVSSFRPRNMKLILRSKEVSYCYRAWMRIIRGIRPGARAVFKVDQLRSQQEHRLARSRESLNEARRRLSQAIALAEAREREVYEVSEDVQRKLAALDLVISIARELGLGDEVSTGQRLNAAGEPTHADAPRITIPLLRGDSLLARLSEPVQNQLD